MHFCIRDDDTSYFTSPEELERAYGEITKSGPVSLAIIPFCKAGTSKGVPEKYRRRWSIHPLHENRELVEWLRKTISAKRFEPMLHGYHHDEEDRLFEFIGGNNLHRRVRDGRKYLEDLLGAAIRVFVPPRNGIGRQGLQAIAAEGLHLGGVAGVRSGWDPLSCATWMNWWQLRSWRMRGGRGTPWILNLDDHKEIAGNAVTPTSSLHENEARYECAKQLGGVFCLATHYWELDKPCKAPNAGTVHQQMQRLVDRAKSDPKVVWRSVGDILSGNV
jgi:predicted deacetylase